MSQFTNLSKRLQSNLLSLNEQSQIKGGKKSKDPYKKALKVQKKLLKAMKKGDQKKMDKYQDELDCLGFANLGCCGNGNGAW